MQVFHPTIYCLAPCAYNVDIHHRFEQFISVKANPHLQSPDCNYPTPKRQPRFPPLPVRVPSDPAPGREALAGQWVQGAAGRSLSKLPPTRCPSLPSGLLLSRLLCSPCFAPLVPSVTAALPLGCWGLGMSHFYVKCIASGSVNGRRKSWKPSFVLAVIFKPGRAQR